MNIPETNFFWRWSPQYRFVVQRPKFNKTLILTPSVPHLPLLSSANLSINFDISYRALQFFCVELKFLKQLSPP